VWPDPQGRVGEKGHNNEDGTRRQEGTGSKTHPDRHKKARAHKQLTCESGVHSAARPPGEGSNARQLGQTLLDIKRSKQPVEAVHIADGITSNQANTKLDTWSKHVAARHRHSRPSERTSCCASASLSSSAAPSFTIPQRGCPNTSQNNAHHVRLIKTRQGNTAVHAQSAFA